MSPQPLLRPYEPGDEAAILRAHTRVFAHVDPACEPRSLAHWSWQFTGNPAGSRIVLALGADGEVRGQYAGIRQRIHSEAALAHFTQAVDSFDTARVDGGLSRTSAFVRAGEYFARHYCGEAKEQDQVVWGLAIQSVWRIGASRLGYEHVRTVNALVARTGELVPAGEDALSVEECERCPHDIGELFERVAAERGAIALRDRATMDWRYSSHPSRAYTFGALREQGQLRGLGVYRRGAFAGHAGGLVCDWLVPPADEAAVQALMEWFRRRALADSAGLLIALLPDTAPEWLEFQRRGFRVVPTEYILAARSFRAPFDRDFLFWRWYYTLGDTDLV